MASSEWSHFFLGELTAAAALAGLLFASVSVNQTRIPALGRMADRGLEALIMLFIVIASLPLVPGQPLRLLGAEILAIASATLVAPVPLQRAYLRELDPSHRPLGPDGSGQPIGDDSDRAGRPRAALAGRRLRPLYAACLYMLPLGILLFVGAVGANACLLLIEINR